MRNSLLGGRHVEGVGGRTEDADPKTASRGLGTNNRSALYSPRKT